MVDWVLHLFLPKLSFGRIAELNDLLTEAGSTTVVKPSEL
jgi:hypothetical protein